jgi:uncharacterized protein YoxC
MDLLNEFEVLWEMFAVFFKPLIVIFPSHLGIFLYCSFIICWAGLAAYIFNVRLSPVQNQLEQMKKKLFVIDGREEFAEKYYEFDNFCKQLPVVSKVWQEFSDVLLFPGTDLERKSHICNTKDPGLYFSHRTILWPYISVRFYNSLPNLLTGVGILGTFIGLVAGIALAAPGLNSSNIQDAKIALENLLSGASLAFLTSIFGLTSSILFSSYEKHKIHKFDKTLHRLVAGLEERLEYISVEKISSQALRESVKQTSSLESFSNDLAVSLGDLLANKITEPMNATMTELGIILKEQIKILEGIRQDQQQASDETLTRLIREFSESITNAAGKEMQAFANTVTHLADRLDTQIETMAKSQESMQKASQESVQKLQDSFQENTKKLQGEVSSAITTMVDGVRITVQEMTEMLEKATSESAENMMQVSEKFGNSITDLEATVSRMGQELQEATNESAKTMREISGQFNESVSTLKETILDMSEISNSTLGILDKLEALTETINTSHENLQKVGEQIQNTSQEMSKASIDIAEVSNIFKITANNMDEINTGFKQNIQTIQTVYQELKQSWHKHLQRFEGVDLSLTTIFKEIEQGLDSYAESTRNYVEQLDLHASRVVNHLAGATSELRDNIEDLGDVLGSFERIREISTNQETSTN